MEVGKGGGLAGGGRPLTHKVLCDVEGWVGVGPVSHRLLREESERRGEQHPTTPFKIDHSHHLAFASVISSQSATGLERNVLNAATLMYTVPLVGWS